MLEKDQKFVEVSMSIGLEICIRNIINMMEFYRSRYSNMLAKVNK